MHLPVSVTQLNGIPRQYLSTLAVRDPAQGYLTSPTVANPFSGLTTSQNTATTTIAQLLARYPEFPVGDSATGWSGSSGVLEQNLNVGSSYFHSLNVRLQKRVSGGLNLTVNYIHSRLIEYDSWLNSSDPRPEKRVSPTDRPNRFVTAVTYELPVGQGKKLHFQSRLANTLIGDWVITTMYQYQTGAPDHVRQRQHHQPRRLRLSGRAAQPEQPPGQRHRVRYHRLRHQGRRRVQLPPAHLPDHLQQPARRWHQPVGRQHRQALQPRRAPPLRAAL